VKFVARVKGNRGDDGVLVPSVGPGLARFFADHVGAPEKEVGAQDVFHVVQDHSMRCNGVLIRLASLLAIGGFDQRSSAQRLLEIFKAFQIAAYFFCIEHRKASEVPFKVEFLHLV
jgi:hypothetical protein